jgi:hypothetical protein
MSSLSPASGIGTPWTAEQVRDALWVQLHGIEK